MSPRSSAIVSRSASPTAFDDAVIGQFMRLALIIRFRPDLTIRDAICGNCQQVCEAEANSCTRCEIKFSALLALVRFNDDITDAYMLELVERIHPHNRLPLIGTASSRNKDEPPYWFHSVLDPSRDTT